ncbi:MAG: dTDP-4-dehydrorhamnose reductase [Candidatus Uhrbacteria bacterium GW2011_GWD2_52_7]|uniref:dTDP-4-dehydrorhamnose reductase n=1 Tax=Candidatus Uhrbacteria bacterium GW2011_GWD2_52_7 TaxID=1618989 RepID=A0A0G2AC85_9BACT|nr:MAG: dTDP-4-dehydrorhamnose reductase [Candidatus Uhrbacteria bacterium GW2011_GWD2_52_7]
MKALITGANGMLGQELRRIFSDEGYEVVATDRETLDITDRDQVLAFVRECRPDVVINAAAYNLVDKVEEANIYPIAYAINALGPKNLAEAAKAIGVPFVHFSTDYVFAGNKLEGYAEDDATSPLSKYGQTKAEGERFVQEVGGTFYICRLSKLFGRPGLGEGSKVSFVELMLRLAKEKPELSIVDDEVGCPTYAPDLACATFELVTKPYPPGVYHLVNSGEPVTWYAFAQEIFALAGVATPRKPVPSSAFPRAAQLPKAAALLNTKFLPLRSRKEALEHFLT